MAASRSPTATSSINQCATATPLISVPKVPPDAIALEGGEAGLEMVSARPHLMPMTLPEEGPRRLL